MNTFENYLIQLQYSNKTVSCYCHFVNSYKTYCNNKNINYNNVDYNVIIKYISYLNKRNNQNSIVSNLTALKHFYNYKNLKYNPVKINIKRRVKNIQSKQLTSQELHMLFDKFKTNSLFDIRNKVAISLFIFQAIQSYELKHIELQHIDLQRLTITIPKTSKSNKRVISLHIKQVLLINEYLILVRSKLLLKHKENCNYFIVTSSFKNNFNSILNQINKKLHHINSNLSLNKIRQHVIINWLKQHNIRQTQHLAGHKYISSTERYIVKDLQQLKISVVKCHPL